MKHPGYFEYEFRGIKAIVEPENSQGRWEYWFSHEDAGDWKSLGIGCYPAVSIAEAGAAIDEKLKQEHSLRLAKLYEERESVQEQITKLRAP